MKAHRTDGVSLTFGMIFLLIAAWWLVAQLLDLPIPAVGWFVAGGLILFGVLGLLAALRSGAGQTATRPARGEPAVLGDPPAPESPAILRDQPQARPTPECPATPADQATDRLTDNVTAVTDPTGARTNSTDEPDTLPLDLPPDQPVSDEGRD